MKPSICSGGNMDTMTAERNRKIIESFRVPERILFLFSKDPASVFRNGYEGGASGEWNSDNALSVLRREFPDFDALIRDKRVLDYGCGDGFQSIAMAKAGAARVFGVDLDESRLVHARRLARGVDNLSFSEYISEEVDLAISLNAFEHFPEPSGNLRELSRAVRAGGQILITFGPPWLAPFGAHVGFFTSCPWANVLFSVHTLNRVRMLYRGDAQDDVDYGPNKITVRSFENLIEQSGLLVERLEYRTAKNLPLGRIPGVREFFINHITCILRRPA